MQLFTPPDITGDGALHTIASIPGLATQAARWWQFQAVTIASTPALVGDALIQTSAPERGIPLQSGDAQFSPPLSQEYDPYDLTKIYYILQSGDVARFACVI